jgi:hypothetical protein
VTYCSCFSISSREVKSCFSRSGFSSSSSSSSPEPSWVPASASAISCCRPSSVSSRKPCRSALMRWMRVGRASLALLSFDGHDRRDMGNSGIEVIAVVDLEQARHLCCNCICQFTEPATKEQLTSKASKNLCVTLKTSVVARQGWVGWMSGLLFLPV